MYYKLFIGLNDQHTKKQETATENAVSIVSRYAVERFGGVTISTARGVYTHENGDTIEENTIIVEVFGVPRTLVEAFADDMKRIFNQESIGLAEFQTLLEFI